MTEDDQRHNTANDEDETRIAGENAAIDSQSSVSAKSADPSDAKISNLPPGAGVSSSHHEAIADGRTTPSPPAADLEDAETILAETPIEEVATQLAESKADATVIAVSDSPPSSITPSTPSSTPLPTFGPYYVQLATGLESTLPKPCKR